MAFLTGKTAYILKVLILVVSWVPILSQTLCLCLQICLRSLNLYPKPVRGIGSSVYGQRHWGFEKSRNLLVSGRARSWTFIGLQGLFRLVPHAMICCRTVEQRELEQLSPTCRDILNTYVMWKMYSMWKSRLWNSICNRILFFFNKFLLH